MNAAGGPPNDGEGQAWPANKAVLLTLVVVTMPYAALGVLAAITSTHVLAGSLLLACGSRYWWSASQRLVRFMLTGEILPADAAAGADSTRPAPAVLRRAWQHPFGH